jgi:hypothetical protein
MPNLLHSSKRDSHHDNVSTTFLRRSQWASLREPVAVGILINPVDNCGLLLLGDALFGVGNALKDVVDVLGDTEHTRPGLGYCANEVRK